MLLLDVVCCVVCSLVVVMWMFIFVCWRWCWMKVEVLNCLCSWFLCFFLVVMMYVYVMRIICDDRLS